MLPAELIIKGIKCDANGCDYKDDSVTDFRGMLNAPCPKCGANLLTKEDYEAIATLQYIADLDCARLGNIPDGTARESLPIKMDGTGKIDISAWPDVDADNQDA